MPSSPNGTEQTQNLSQRSRDTVESVALRSERQVHIGQRYSVTKERIRQVAGQAFDEIHAAFLSNPGSAVIDAIHTAARIVDTAAIEDAFDLRSSRSDRSQKLTSQLVNINAISSDEAQWALATFCFIPTPKPKRPTLRGLAAQARQIAAQHHLGISVDHLRQQLQTWEPRIAAWPHFDLASHIQAMTGVTPSPDHLQIPSPSRAGLSPDILPSIGYVTTSHLPSSKPENLCLSPR